MLEVRGVSVQIGQVLVLDRVSLTARDGAVTAVMGPSGSGKTTLLRAIAGLQETSTGTIDWNSRPLDGLPPHRRGVGLMFQDHALFPHRDVAGNVAFGLEMQELETDDIGHRVADALTMVGLDGFEARDIESLSGGEQQRVALARAIAPEPRLLMLDEPLGSLDRSLREDLMVEMRTLFSTLGLTVLYVTHDHDEVFAIADDMLVLDEGRVMGAGQAEALWADPRTEFVARFLGHRNIIDIDVADGTFELGGSRQVVDLPDGPGTLLIPRESLRLDPSGMWSVQAVASTFRAGVHTTVVAFDDGRTLVVPGGPVPAGSTVRVAVDPSMLRTLRSSAHSSTSSDV